MESESNDETIQEVPTSETLVLTHPKAHPLSPDFIRRATMHWTEREEDELLHGVLFLLERLHVINVSTYRKLIKEVASYLTFTLHDKANDVIILRKMRHLTDLYRHYKKFFFMRHGLSYNPHTSETKCGPKYWRTVEQESELDAYFRTYGFRHYKSCCRILDFYKLDQFASYIDEAVYRNIPVGFGITGPDAFVYPIHRARFPLLQKNEMDMCYKDSGWTTDDWDEYFFHAGWYPYDDWEFMDLFEDVVEKREIDCNLSFMLMVSEIARRYNKPENPLLTYDGILDKIRSMAYVHQLFKRFVFKTIGVEYNFLMHESKVNDVYWNHKGKEPMYMWMFRTNGFPFYQKCYYVFEEKGVERYIHGYLAHIDPEIPKGVKISEERNVFKCYYQDD